MKPKDLGTVERVEPSNPRGAIMERGAAQAFLRSIFGPKEGTTLSRRDALAGLGLAGLLLAAPKLLSSNPAEAKPLDKPAEAAAGYSPATEAKTAETHEAQEVDITDLSSRRYWRRRYWRRRYWRHRYWRRRHWRRRYWRRRYWY